MVGPLAKVLPAWCAVLCMALRSDFELGTQAGSLDVQRNTDAWWLDDFEEVDCPADAGAVMALKTLGMQEPGFGAHHCEWKGITCRGCKVTSISLEGNLRITGSIKQIQHFTELEILNLQRTKVFGDIEALANLTKLRQLLISGASVAGDVSNLKALKQLQALNLEGASVSGDISNLKKLVQLQWLCLRYTHVSGHVSDLKALRQLGLLALTATQVSGDVSDLKTLTQLKVLFLAGTHVSGLVSNLNALTQLQSLELRATQVSGDISNLTALTRLQKLALDATQVSGDVSSLKPLTQLRWLSLRRTQVSGHVSELKAMNQLQTLELERTQVSGNFSDLKVLTRLQRLFLRGTRVSGHVSDLRVLIELQVLQLERTQLSGDVSHLKVLAKLQRLFLRGTQVSGHVSNLKVLTQLQILDLEGTQVSGDISGLKELTQLRTLTLGKTQVSGNMSDLKALCQMETLVLTAIPLSGDVSALKGLTRLKVLWLLQTKVAGDMSALKTLAGLREVSLADTRVYGDLGVLTALPHLTTADLRRTSVSGRWTPSWRGCCRNLRTLLLSGSKANLLPEGEKLADLRKLWTPEKHPDRAFLPALTTLEASGCPLRGSLKELLLILAASPAVSRILADGSNLTGSLPRLWLDNVRVNGEHFDSWKSPLSQSLQTLEVSNNQINAVEGLEASTRLGLAQNGSPLRLADGLLQKALSKAVTVDLQGTSLTDSSQPEHLMSMGMLQMTAGISMIDESKGIACHGLVSSTLQVSPDLFLPDRLCGCLAGWHGTGASCEMCPQNQYSAANSATCAECPRNSTSAKGSSSMKQCVCEIGKIYTPAAQGLEETQPPSNGARHECGCVEGQALHEGACVPCADLHLDCSGPGFVAVTAPAAVGWMRLKAKTEQTFRCTDPAERRCKPDGPDGCAKGYAGPLCVTCAEGHHAAGSVCKECTASFQIGDMRKAMAAGIAVALIAAAVAMWRRWRSPAEIETAAPKPRDAALALLKAQGPLLLQLCQLWIVLAVLASAHGGPESKVEKDADRGFVDSFWEEPYIQWLQLSAQGLQDALNLECSYGAAARLTTAVAAPLMPLMLLALCFVVELVFHSTGIGMALKVLTLFFVGGAVGCAKLLTCQDVDGGGKALSKDIAFRLVMPDLKCSTRSWVDAIGWACLLAYGVLIPLGLLTLMIKQHIALHSIRRIQPLATKEHGKLLIRLNEFGVSHDKCAEKAQRFEKNLLAAVVSHTTVLFRGKVRVQKEKGGMTLKFVDEGAILPDVAADGFGEMLEIQRSADVQRCTTITRMLMERCVLEESASDRILTGAKELFTKYVWCQDVWVEIVMRLAAVALVSVVSVPRGLGLSVGITSLVGVMVGFVQPYAQRQVNHLQCCCFICLAVAAVGFGFKWIWLARAALVLPFLVACGQLKNPDCPEALALRLFKALEPQLEELSEGREFVVEELSL